MLDETAVPYSIHVSTTEDTSQPPDFVPLDEILNLDIATKDGTVIPFKFVLDQPDLQDLSAEIQKLKDENRRLKMLQKLQAEFKKLKRENQKLRKQTNTQPTQASE